MCHLATQEYYVIACTWDRVTANGGGDPLCALDPLSGLAVNTKQYQQFNNILNSHMKTFKFSS